MNKKELAEQLSKRTGLTRAKSLEAIDALFGRDGIITDTLAGGGKVVLTAQQSAIP